jgi:hypothetical protein
MKYGYEKVLEVQRRCGVSFEEADKALKSERGNVDRACAYAIRKKKPEKTKSVLKKEVGSLTNFITYRIKISKNGDTKFDMSMGIVLLISLPVFIFSWAVEEFGILGVLYFCIFAITVFAGYSLEFVPAGKKAEEKLEKVAKKEKSEEEVYENNADQEVAREADGFNSIEIE